MGGAFTREHDGERGGRDAVPVLRLGRRRGEAGDVHDGRTLGGRVGGTFHVILQSKHRSIDDSQVGGVVPEGAPPPDSHA